MKVADVMSYEPIVVDASASTQAAAEKMRAHVVGALPVVEDGVLVGMVTDRDLALRVVGAGASAAETSVHAVMTPRPIICRADELLEAAIERMYRRCVRRIVVVDQAGAVRGILSVDDLVFIDETRPLALRVLRQIAALRGDLDGAFVEVQP